jgi:hypothetical protein
MRFGERFLQRPDDFPRCSGGDAWGRGTVTLRFSGGPYTFSGLRSDQECAVRERFQGFCEPAGGDDAVVVCRVYRCPSEIFRRFDLRGWEMSLDGSHSLGEVRAVGLDLMARLDWQDKALSAALWTPSAGGPWFAGVLENVFRMLVAYRLLEIGGLLLHSAALSRGDAAWVFPGRSGAGKSTLAALAAAQGCAVLSDDLNALVPDGSRFTVEGVPFAGDQRATSRELRPLAGVGLLRQGASVGFTPASRGEAIAGLLSCAPYVNQDPHRLEALAANVARLLDTSRPDKFTFAMTSDVASVLVERAVA